MLPAIAEAVGLRFEAKDEPKEQLLRFLRQKKLLLVLDNFEHLRLGASLLDEMLAAAAGLKLLVTSREKLHLQAEQLFLIGGMTFPVGREQASEELETPLTSFSAIQLFCERAQRAQPGFVLTQANQSHVVEICHLVQGMPLGIVLAAAWLEMLSPQDITAELRQSLDFLESTMKDVPDRQHSLRAAFNYSWRMLSERERHIFQQLSIFRGGFTRQAAQAITAASLQDLQGLVNKSMLTVMPEGRYEIHELLRQFGAEMLAQAVELETEVRARHSAYYCCLLHEHTESWHNARQLETFNTHTQEANNVQVAWSRALESGAWLDLLQAIDSLAWYFDWHGRYAEDASTFQRIIEKIEALDDQKEGRSAITERLLAKALAWQGKFAMNNHDGLQLFQDAMLVIGRLELGGQDIRREKAFTLFGMGARFNGVDRHKSRQLIEQSLAIYQEIDNSWGTAMGLVALGKLDWGTGHYALAQERLQAGLALHQARGDERNRLAPLNALGWNQKHLGHLEESERLHREVLVLAQRLGDRSTLAVHTADLSYILLWEGKFEEELSWAERSLSICLEDGHRNSEGYAHLAICFPLIMTGQYGRARQEAVRALSTVREADNPGIEATVYWVFGCLALTAHSYDEAQAAFIQSRRLYQEVQDNYLGVSLIGLGYTACCQRNFSQACLYFSQALQNALHLKDYLHLMVALPGVALLQAMTDRLEQAVATWELAKCFPYVANSRWHAEIVGQVIEAGAATLPAELVQSARERGSPWIPGRRASGCWQNCLQPIKQSYNPKPEAFGECNTNADANLVGNAA